MRFVDRMRVAFWLWRGRAALKAGRVDKAEAWLEAIEETVPGQPPAMEFRRMVQQAALDRGKRLVEEAPESVEARGDYARALLAEERHDEAHEQAQAGLRLIAASAKAAVFEKEMLQIAAEAAFERGLFAEALDLFRKGEEPGFAMASIHYYRGLCHLAMGDRAACRREFEALVRQAHWAVGIRHAELGQRRAGGGR